MYKKILFVGMFALGLNGMTLADDIGGSEYTAGVATESNTGIFLGGQLGASNMHYKSSSYLLPTTAYENNYQFAVRGYLGYAFNQFISAELGYNYYGRPKFKGLGGNIQDILQHGLDLMARATLPLDYGFGVYCKAGLAWVYRSALHPNVVNGASTFADKPANNKFAPVGALGVNYWFAPNIALDLGWTKSMSIGNLPTIDLLTVGFTYKINV